MKVSQYMSRPALTIEPQTEFHRAFDLMHSRRIHHRIAQTLLEGRLAHAAGNGRGPDDTHAAASSSQS